MLTVSHDPLHDVWDIDDSRAGHHGRRPSTSVVTMPGLTTLPAFPEDVPTHPLLVVDYELVKARDANEINKLWEAATKLGFW